MQRQLQVRQPELLLLRPAHDDYDHALNGLRLFGLRHVHQRRMQVVVMRVCTERMRHQCRVQPWVQLLRKPVRIL